MNFEIIDKALGRYQIFEGITEKELEKIGNDKTIKTIQFSRPLNIKKLELLEKFVFSKRNDILLRVYGFYKECDLSFLKEIPSLTKFSADCLSEAKGVNYIAKLKNLCELGIGIYNLKDFDFLENLNPRLKQLYITKTQSKKPNIKFISRFSELESLYLEGQQNGIESLNELKKLKKLTLRSISTKNIDYLSNLEALKRLEIKLGGIKEFEALKTLPNLAYLELWQVRGLNNLDFISDLTSLQMISLESLKNITTFPNVEKLKLLRRISLENMKGLKNIENIKKAQSLEDFIFFEAFNLEPKSTLPILENPNIKNVRCFFGSEKKNKEFEGLAKKYNKTNRITLFELNTVPNTV
ncbi:hypothetical protein [uncultured Polaribacter sp.]|uniref:hypothetical protein n=1 Tax=uncultured Polaribacter sp. TaxID=174711 RepID=UPI00263272D0|nr:hypothetical protein [uncultured Polaribacter sp.]